MSGKPVRQVVIVGGGTAGWLAACRLAAAAGPRLAVTLVESPDVPTIGVGEGTWPTMRRTLQAIGIDEAAFLLACDASFKQGSRFDGWRDGGKDDRYYHPFVPPVEADARALVAAWAQSGRAFADVAGAQPRIAAMDLAPRQRAMPGYAGALNYAYHLDAGKFAAMLAAHGTATLGVRHVRDHVTGLEAGEDGGIAAVTTRTHGRIAGDLFLDCSGHAALLIGQHLRVGLVDRGAELFNDRALAVQVPVAPDSPIASQTNATAHAAGWTWDIGLPTRRGIGCVYSSRHMDDDTAAGVLDAYIAQAVPGADRGKLSPRRLAFRSAHRERFWVGNCVALGQAAGFLEPLEASAIVMAELAIDALVDNFPASAEAMRAHAVRFDRLFRYRWDRIVEFLKLHYVLSTRPEPYWRDHRDPATVPPRLHELMAVWRDQPPSPSDLPQVDEVFPAASYQYVLYGMGHPAPKAGVMRAPGPPSPATAQVEQRARALAAALPTNRAYLDALAAAHPARSRETA